MNINDIILKQDNPKKLKDFEKVWPMVEKYCSVSLLDFKKTGELLYRGIETKTKYDIFIGQNRDKRNTIESWSQRYAYLFDNILKYYHFDALRLNSIFCNSSSGNSEIYGKLYIIFPINGFSFTWSKLFTNVNAKTYFTSLKYSDTEIADDIVRKNNFNYDSLIQNKDFIHLAKEIKKLGSFSNKNFKQALKSANDIWIHGKYIAFYKNEYYGMIRNKINEYRRYNSKKR